MAKEPKTVQIDVIGGKLHLTERELKHPKTGKMTTYISFSNGQDVAGVYLEEKTKKEIAKFFNGGKSNVK